MRILVTAGPTREAIDDVRFISNRSSGRMGLALADAAADAGHRVTLLLGPVMLHAAVHERCEVVRFSSAADLQRLLVEHFPECDVLIMAAAVADYRPVRRVAGKLPRLAGEEGGESGGMTLQLEPVPDLVAEVAATKRPGQRVIAFALEEPAKLEARAAEKMRRKGVDAIVANPLETMEDPRIRPVVLNAGGQRLDPGALSKADFARWLVAHLGQL